MLMQRPADTDLPTLDRPGVDGMLEDIETIGSDGDFHDAAEMLAGRLFRFMMIDEHLLFASFTSAGGTGLIHEPTVGSPALVRYQTVTTASNK